MPLWSSPGTEPFYFRMERLEMTFFSPFYQFSVSSGKDMRQENPLFAPRKDVWLNHIPQDLLSSHSWAGGALLGWLAWGQVLSFHMAPGFQTLFWKASFSYTKQHLRKSKRFIFNGLLKHSKSPILDSRARCKTRPSCSIKVKGCSEQGAGQSERHKLRTFSGLSPWWTGVLSG